MNEEMLSIKDICAIAELSSVYVRRMIQLGKLPSTRVTLNKGFKHFVKREDFEAWRAQCAHRTPRADGRSKYVLYGNEAEIEKLTELLNENNIETPIERARKAKAIEATVAE